MADLSDISLYTDPVRLDARGAIWLVTQLLLAAPAEPSKPVKLRLRRLRDVTLTLKGELKARARATKPVIKPIDTNFDLGWSSLRDRLTAWARNANPKFEAERKRAAFLDRTYFPKGVQFVTGTYENEYVDSQELLERMEEESTRKDFVRLCGAEFVENVEYFHALLGEAIGMTKRKPGEPDPRGVANAVSAVAQALTAYVLKLGGELSRTSLRRSKRLRRPCSPSPNTARRARAARARSETHPSPMTTPTCRPFPVAARTTTAEAAGVRPKAAEARRPSSSRGCAERIRFRPESRLTRDGQDDLLPRDGSRETQADQRRRSETHLLRAGRPRRVRG